MIEVPADSPRFSLKGWLFSEWLSKNKAWVKAPIVLLFAYISWVVTPVEPPELKALLVAVLTVAGRFSVDLVDYWISEVTAK